ncbi:MAG: hypothetical protein KC503_38360 [Myxococcales bacterium]|nr:hypothetical protein [Myxococcales bacterium]
MTHAGSAHLDDDALIALLAPLCQAHGAETLLAAPLVDASERCFPEPFEPSLLGVAQALVPLLCYAGLGGYRLELVDARAPLSEQAMVELPAVELCAVEDDGRLVFQVDRVGRKPQALYGALAYEVARAFVATRDAEHPYRESFTERAAQLHSEPAALAAAAATIYLGFGPVVVAACGAYHVAGEMLGNTTFTSYAHQSVGPLGARDMGALLAMQLALRGEDRDSAAALLRGLGANQQAAVGELLDTFGEAPARDALAAAIGADISDDKGAYEVRALPALPQPLISAALLETIAADEAAAQRPNEGAQARRYYQRKTVSWLFIGLFAAMVPAIIAVANGRMAIAGLLMLACGALGAAFGRTRRILYCEACGMLVREHERRCPRCAATLGEAYPESARREHLDDDDSEDDEALAEAALAARGEDFGEHGRV